MTTSLDAFFHPRSIAVVGASRRRGCIGGDLFHNLVSRGLDIPVYPVNPAAAAVQSVHAFPRVSAIPGPVDLAVIAVAAPRVLETIEDCAQAGVKAAVVLSAGFRETGEEGRAREEALRDRCRALGIRLIGPNCLGILGTDPALELNATFAPTFPPAGGIAFGSQSGALGLAILDYARDLGLGISQFVSLGNKADVSGNDLLEHWEQDPRTRQVLFYLESLGNPRRFMEIARRVTRRKPVVVVKAGRTTAGARAAHSHTGALAGTDVAVDALLGQAGVIRTDTMEQLFDVARLLAHQPVPRGGHVAILTNGGGPGIMAADACETHGLEVPPLASATEAGLRAFLPAEASVRNPVDMIASAPAASYARALRLLLDDPGVDAALVLFVHPLVTRASDVAAAVEEVARAGTNGKPIAACLLGTEDVPEAVGRLRRAGVPCYAFPETAVIALSRVVRYGRYLAQPPAAPARLDVDEARARAVLEAARARCASAPAGAAWLAPAEVAGLLEAYGLRLAVARAAASEDEAVAHAQAVGFPVAVKLSSRTITHKTDVGGVHLSIGDAAGVRAAWRAIRARLAALGREGEMDGVVVQPMVSPGVEMLVGATEAGAFGALVGVGLGGVHVELFGDVSFGVPPLAAREAADLVDRLRGRKLLEGFRGAPPADRAALEEAVLRVSQLVTEHPEIAELDINPLVVHPAGRGATAVDARVRLRPAR